MNVFENNYSEFLVEFGKGRKMSNDQRRIIRTNQGKIRRVKTSFEGKRY